MRTELAKQLHKHMKKDPRIVLIVGDLGYGLFNQIRDDYPDRFINAGASEQAMMGIAVGLSLSGRRPVVYSITNFLLYRPFETIRNYISYEQIPVMLVASGRDKDYEHDGISHWSEDAWKLFAPGPQGTKPIFHISDYWPLEPTEIEPLITRLFQNFAPCFVSLKR